MSSLRRPDGEEEGEDDEDDEEGEQGSPVSPSKVGSGSKTGLGSGCVTRSPGCVATGGSGRPVLNCASASDVTAVDGGGGMSSSKMAATRTRAFPPRQTACSRVAASSSPGPPSKVGSGSKTGPGGGCVTRSPEGGMSSLRRPDGEAEGEDDEDDEEGEQGSPVSPSKVGSGSKTGPGGGCVTRIPGCVASAPGSTVVTLSASGAAAATVRAALT